MNIPLPQSSFTQYMHLSHHHPYAGNWGQNTNGQVIVKFHLDNLYPIQNVSLRIGVTPHKVELFYGELERTHPKLLSDGRSRIDWGIYTDRLRLWDEVETENVQYQLQDHTVHVILEKVDRAVIWPVLMLDYITFEPLVQDWMQEMKGCRRQTG
jgi:hypothetical protein